MKKNLLIVFVVLFALLSLGLGIYCIELNAEIKELKSNNQITDNDIVNNDNNNDNEEEQIELDCSFTRTYKIVNLLDEYIAAVPEVSYVIVDQFQMFSAISHKIPTKLKENLKVGQNYEFTYHIKGKMDSTKELDDDDIIGMIVEKHSDNDNLTVTLKIKETDKTGLGQIQEPICKSSK